VDSADLPLNISRELLQSSEIIDNMKTALSKRALDMLAKLSEKPEEYATFWKAFGQVLKEGIAEDTANRDKIARLLRFASTETGNDEQNVALADYLARLKPGQNKIYYITAETHAAASHSPHLEIFRKKGVEVLLLSDRLDEWLMSYLTEFDGKSFQHVAKGDLDLGELDSDEEKAEQEKQEEAGKGLIERLEKALAESVDSVKITHRLTDSPACLVLNEHDMGAQLRQLLAASGQSLPNSKPVLEINLEHALVKRLDGEQDEARFGNLAAIIHDQAVLAEGGQLTDPAAYVRRINELLLAS